MTSLKFEDWAAQWLSYKRDFVKESTYANYLIAMVNHIEPLFSGMYVEEITTKKIQEAVLMWSEAGRLDASGGLSAKTVKDMTTVLKICLRDYEEMGGGEVTIKRIEYPARNKYTGEQMKNTLSKEQQDALLAAVSADFQPESLGYAIAVYTGLRIGELCALKWENVDMSGRMIWVGKTLQRIYYKTGKSSGTTKVIISTPKSEKSVRGVPISKSLYAFLKKQKHINKKAYVLTGDEHYIEPRLYRSHYARFEKKHHLEHIRFHGLRHTFATRLIEAGADYKVVSELLGHSSVSITLNLYVHPNLDAKRRCVDLIS